MGGGPSDWGDWGQFDPFGNGDAAPFARLAQLQGLNDQDAMHIYNSMSGDQKNQWRQMRSGDDWITSKGTAFLKGLSGYKDIQDRVNPKPPPAPVDLTDETLASARKAQMQRLLSGQGRSSSFLSGPAGTAANAGYGSMTGRSSSLLGG